MMGCVGVLAGLLTLAYVVTGVLGVVQLLVFWNWSGFFQWTALSLGIAVVRFFVVGVSGMIQARRPGPEGDAFRRRIEQQVDEGTELPWRR